MKRRNFLASLFAPLIASCAPKHLCGGQRVIANRLITLEQMVNIREDWYEYTDCVFVIRQPNPNVIHWNGPQIPFVRIDLPEKWPWQDGGKS